MRTWIGALVDIARRAAACLPPGAVSLVWGTLDAAIQARGAASVVPTAGDRAGSTSARWSC